MTSAPDEMLMCAWLSAAMDEDKPTAAALIEQVGLESLVLGLTAACLHFGAQAAGSDEAFRRALGEYVTDQVDPSSGSGQTAGSGG